MPRLSAPTPCHPPDCIPVVYSCLKGGEQDKKAAATAEMGQWIAEYLDDAGYQHWDTQSAFMKAIFINAFPPIGELDGTPLTYSQMSPIVTARGSNLRPAC